MIDSDWFVSRLRHRGIAFFSGVPDSLLAPVCETLAAPGLGAVHVPAVNEGGAVGLAIGHHLATGETPLVYLQNSGLGHAVNPMLALADTAVYAIPMVLLVGWRGEPGRPDEPQHRKVGQVMTALFDAMKLPWYILADTPERVDTQIARAVTAAVDGSQPVALVVRSGLFRKGRPAADKARLPSREAAVEQVLDVAGEGDVLVATTGMIGRELYALRDRRRESHDRDFLTVGGMGHASQIAWAIAGARRERRVWCLDGDGAMLMHLGGLATNRYYPGIAMCHVLLNNGAHDSVGGMPTVARDIDLVTIARAMGYGHTARVDTAEALVPALAAMRSAEQAAFLDVRVRRGFTAGLGRPCTLPLDNKRDLMAFLKA